MDNKMYCRTCDKVYDKEEISIKFNSFLDSLDTICKVCGDFVLYMDEVESLNNDK